jgi:hypothetical protein
LQAYACKKALQASFLGRGVRFAISEIERIDLEAQA